MKKYEFNYNKKFSCIGSNCKHNCCIGWEISIDKKSLNTYTSLLDTDKRFSKDCFLINKFNLKNNRCPFLDGNNLCYIIKNYGEKLLCRTCKTHPRFKSFFSGITETGLGFYCEHACKIILLQKTKMKTVLVSDDNKPLALTKHEKNVISFRKKVLSFLQNRKLNIDERISQVEKLSNIDLNKKSFNDYLQIFCSLENLKINDFNFKKIHNASDFLPLDKDFSNEYEQILSYLVFRHLSRSIDNLDLRVRLAFVILCFKMINHIFCLNENKNIDSLVESCRFFSSEIETSDDNIFTLLNEIEKLVSFI